jgi:hypothetical protein
VSTKRVAARKALKTYVDLKGHGERDEPRDWQASDLVTDLLLTFSPEDAATILDRVERDSRMERT